MKEVSKAITCAMVVGILHCGAAYALDPVPEESGFSGYLSLGGAYTDAKTNMIAGNDFVDMGNSRTYSLTDSPDSKSIADMNFNFDLRYTFASTRTQIFLGNSLEDALRYDLTSQLGVAQELPSKDLLAVSFLFSSFPTEVWQDPYVTFYRRQKTDRNSNGVRLSWDRILGSELQLEYSYRKIDLDDEYSGVYLGLNPFERAMLDRDGDQYKAEALYRFFWDQKQHVIIPAVIYRNYDLDGDAMANDGFDFQLSYGYNAEKYSLVVNALIGYADFDKINPIYLKTRDDDHYGIGLVGFYKSPFGWSMPGFKGTSLYFRADYANGDSNINFYDTEISSVGTGLFFRF